MNGYELGRRRKRSEEDELSWALGALGVGVVMWVGRRLIEWADRKDREEWLKPTWKDRREGPGSRWRDRWE